MRVVSPQRVCIDTSELFPFTIMDVLLTLAENLLFTWVWTDDLLDERERVIVEHNHRTPESARSVINAVREWFASGRIEPGLYRDRITDALSPDPDDRAHIAACLDGRAQVILTRNVKDFAAEALQAHGIVVMTADDYLLGLLATAPDGRGAGLPGNRRRAAAPCDHGMRARGSS